MSIHFAHADDPSSNKWPAYIDGKRVPKTFRFKPSSIHYRPLSTRAPKTLVVFGIKEQDIPADYFIFVYRRGSEAEERVKRAIEEDDGYITVFGTWVNLPTPKKDWKGTDESWIDGKMLHGELQTKSKPK